jgi:hypothetical protein
MNAFTDLVFIFVFVFVMLHFDVVDITCNNIILQKFLMFISVTIFAWLLYSIKAIRHKYPINVWNVISNGLIIGMLAFIGHTILFDLLYVPETNIWITSKINDYFTINVITTIFVVLAIALGYAFKCIFTTETCF